MIVTLRGDGGVGQPLPLVAPICVQYVLDDTYRRRPYRSHTSVGGAGLTVVQRRLAELWALGKGFRKTELDEPDFCVSAFFLPLPQWIVIQGASLVAWCKSRRLGEGAGMVNWRCYG